MNFEQLLKEGVRGWNSWRNENPEILINLYGANLCRANLCGANLCGANLCGADLYGANLCGANLCGANLCGADLCGANLCGADLSRTNLCRANLCGANLCGADLYGANLYDFQICPETGSFEAWKQGDNKSIIKLKIPATSKRTSSLVGRKCRAECVEVLEIWDRNGKKIDSVGGWSAPKTFFYTVGETAKSDKYDDDIRIECTHGIHFFVTEREARAF